MELIRVRLVRTVLMLDKVEGVMGVICRFDVDEDCQNSALVRGRKVVSDSEARGRFVPVCGRSACFCCVDSPSS